MFGKKADLKGRQTFVERFEFPAHIADSLRAQYPGVTDPAPAFEGLRQWLWIHTLDAGELLGMPSKAVDLLWHDFILDTRGYEFFCQTAYGGTLHHSPKAALDSSGRQALDTTAMSMTYSLVRLLEPADPANPSQLPALFAADALLGLPDGQHWVNSCGTEACSVEPPSYCVQHQLVPHAPKKLLKRARAHSPVITGVGGSRVVVVGHHPQPQPEHHHEQHHHHEAGVNGPTAEHHGESHHESGHNDPVYSESGHSESGHSEGGFADSGHGESGHSESFSDAGGSSCGGGTTVESSSSSDSGGSSCGGGSDSGSSDSGGSSCGSSCGGGGSSCGSS